MNRKLKHFKDGKLHIYVRTDKYKGKIKSDIWVGRTFIQGNQLVKTSGTSNFNKAKSDLKFIEACAYGIPSICKDLCTYDTAFHKFKTGEDLINKIKLITVDGKKYS